MTSRTLTAGGTGTPQTEGIASAPCLNASAFGRDRLVTADKDSHRRLSRNGRARGHIGRWRNQFGLPSNSRNSALWNIDIIQDCGDVFDIPLPIVGVGLMGLVACPMTASVDQDEPITRLQRFHISEVVPAFQAVGKTVLEHQRLPITLNPLMNSNTLVDRIWHFASPPLNSCGCTDARLGPYDFRFQAGDEGYDLAALWLWHFECVHRRVETAHESRIIGLCDAHPFV